jgi:hypothetical protein
MIGFDLSLQHAPDQREIDQFHGGDLVEIHTGIFSR